MGLLNQSDETIQSRFEKAETVILKWPSSEGSSSPGNSPDETEYLSAVKQIVLLRGHRRIDSGRAEGLLSIAKPRLEQIFLAGLLRLEMFSDSNPGLTRNESSLPAHLREIAELMSRRDCFRICEATRRKYLGKYRPKMDSNDPLDLKTMKWVQAVKKMIDLLSAEKDFFQIVFPVSCFSVVRGDTGCLFAILDGYIGRLLDFGAALVMALRTRSPEDLVRIRDMYQTWASVLPGLEALYSEIDSHHHVLERAKLFLLVLEAYSALSELKNGQPPRDVDIHPSIRSMMRKAVLLSNSNDVPNSVPSSVNNEDQESSSLLEHVLRQDGNTQQDHAGGELDPGDLSQKVNQLRKLMSSLESNLMEQAEEFKDPAMRCIFLMNNIRYVVQKAKSSMLEILLGENWALGLTELTEHYATGYFRFCWPKVLSALEDVKGSPHNLSKLGKMILKQSFKSFNKRFEDVYRKQTAWKVPDTELRENLHVLISQNVIQAYRTFLGRHKDGIESNRNVRKCFKYSEEDLEKYLLDLFQGTALKLPLKKRIGTPALPKWTCFNHGIAVN